MEKTYQVADPSFPGKWKYRMCACRRLVTYIALNVQQLGMAFSLTGVSPFIKNKGVWGGKEVGVINLIYLNNHFW